MIPTSGGTRNEESVALADKGRKMERSPLLLDNANEYDVMAAV
jgi:hypothetical protein